MTDTILRTSPHSGANRWQPLGLRTDPFPASPQSGTFLSNVAHFAVLNTFERWMTASTAAPLALVTGPEGSGKTRLLHEIGRVVAGNNVTRPGIIAGDGTRRTDIQLLRRIIHALDGTPAGRTGLQLQAEARALFAQVNDQGKYPLLLIDDANFTGSQLEIVRSLLSGEPVRMVLFGEPDLADRVQRRQSLQALTGLNEQIVPLTTEEALAFIRQGIDAVRLDRSESQHIIEEVALAMIARQSGGNIGNIGRMMRAVLEESLLHNRVIDTGLVQQVLANLPEPAHTANAPATPPRAMRDSAVQTRIPLDFFQGEESNA